MRCNVVPGALQEVPPGFFFNQQQQKQLRHDKTLKFDLKITNPLQDSFQPSGYLSQDYFALGRDLKCDP